MLVVVVVVALVVELFFRYNCCCLRCCFCFAMLYVYFIEKIMCALTKYNSVVVNQADY